MDISQDTPLFVISVAAELCGMHPQTLRQYDRIGLVSPTRTSGKSRRYTMQDVAKLREVARLISRSSDESTGEPGVCSRRAGRNQTQPGTAP